ncbi:MAG: hypothetical protein Kapaf2KO_14000 [Candidatus Kapaibacteriales bacterium]
MKFFDTAIDVLMFREGGEYENHTNTPTYTTGSIIWGVLLRTVIITILWLLFIWKMQIFDQWFVGLLLVWLIAVFPGYQQYKNFEKRIKVLSDNTLCGTCRHYSQQSQLCTILDEHVSSVHIPCEGSAWEPKPSYGSEE